MPKASLDGIRKIVAEVVQDMRLKGESPPLPLSSKKFRVKFVMRIPPNVHIQLAIKAAEEGISLNRLISAKLTK